MACDFYEDRNSDEKTELFSKQKMDIYVPLDSSCMTIRFNIKDIPIEWEAFSGKHKDNLHYKWKILYYDPTLFHNDMEYDWQDDGQQVLIFDNREKYNLTTSLISG